MTQKRRPGTQAEKADVYDTIVKAIDGSDEIADRLEASDPTKLRARMPDALRAAMADREQRPGLIKRERLILKLRNISEALYQAGCPYEDLLDLSAVLGDLNRGTVDSLLRPVNKLGRPPSSISEDANLVILLAAVELLVELGVKEEVAFAKVAKVVDKTGDALSKRKSDLEFRSPGTINLLKCGLARDGGTSLGTVLALVRAQVRQDK